MKKIFKLTRLLLCIAILFTSMASPILVSATVSYTGKVLASDGLNVRSGPATSYSKLGEIAYGVEVSLVSGSPVSTNGCSSGWYQIEYNGSTDAYVCGTYLSISSTTSTSTTATTEYEKYLEELGFPSTYWDYLTQLHEQHPTWQFEAVQTGLDWSTAVANESIVGVNLIQTSYDGWKSLASGSYDSSTNTFIVLEGSNWYAANEEVVAYYMDPRNFLDEKHIFMFEKLNYDSSYQSSSAVAAVFNGGTFQNYASTFVSAGSSYDVNPIYLASRVRQEVGTNVGSSTSTKGGSFTYNGTTYSGIYNVYNIGAYSSATDGLAWASGYGYSTTSYGRPWTSIETSITYGAQYISTSYIAKGQYTPYFQKFNVSPTAYYSKYSHQYMSNVQAVYSESVSTYSSYESMDLLDNAFKFAIPVYNNMPSSTSLPSTQLDTSSSSSSSSSSSTSGSSSSTSGDETIVTIDANTLISTVGLKTDGTYISGIYEGMEVTLLTTSLKNNGGSITTSAYGNLATGDKIYINSNAYTIILYGDLNSDSNISLADLVQMKKYILGYNNLNTNTKKAADVNKDGSVSLSDLVLMKKKILGLSDIDQ